MQLQNKKNRLVLTEDRSYINLWVNESMSQWTNESTMSQAIFYKWAAHAWTVLCSFVNFILLRVSSITRLRQEGFTNWKVKTTILIHWDIRSTEKRALVFFKKITESDDIAQTCCCQEVPLCHKCQVLFWGLMVSANHKPQNKTRKKVTRRHKGGGGGAQSDPSPLLLTPFIRLTRYLAHIMSVLCIFN